MHHLKESFYKHYLTPNEKVLTISEQHITTRLRYHGIFITAILFFNTVLLYILFPSQDTYFFYIEFGFALSVVPFILYLTVWHALLLRRGAIFTSHRLLIIHNTLFSRKTESIDYERIVSHETNQSILGHILNFGSIELSLYEMKDLHLNSYCNFKDLEKILAQYAREQE